MSLLLKIRDRDATVEAEVPLITQQVSQNNFTKHIHLYTYRFLSKQY